MTNDNQAVGGRYKLGKLIGGGSIGEVYVAKDLTLGRRVAIKLLRPDFSAKTKLRVRFKQEAGAASKLSHPNIARVFDAGDHSAVSEAGTETTRPFIVMEYVEGITLSSLIARGPIKVSETTRIAGELLAAIDFAHEAGIVHRDIKPSNIMLTRSGQVKVLDFGIARAAAEAYPIATERAAVMGNSTYLPPEHARGETIDARSDIYSIGVVLFEMLTGKPPFADAAPFLEAESQPHESVEAPSTLNSRVSPALDHVVMTALTPNRFGRYATAAFFARDLGLAAAGHVPSFDVALDEVDQLFGPLSNANRPVPPEPVLPQDFVELFGTGLDTQLRFEISKRRLPQKNRILVGILATVLATIAIVGMSVWVVNIAPADFFPSTSRTIPDLKNMTFSQASAALEKVNLLAEEATETSSNIKKDLVTRSDPNSGATVDSGLIVIVYVSEGLAKVTVPATVGMTPADAAAAIVGAQLRQGSLTPQNSPNIAENFAIGTTPAAGSEVSEGSMVTLLVSNGKIDLPRVAGMTLKAATDLLRGPTLLLSPTVAADPGCSTGAELVVNRQSVPAGQVTQGIAITLTYCTG